MRRFIITVSLAIGLIAALALAAGIAARPIEPPGTPPVAAAPAACPSASTTAAVVPGGVYRALVSELRQQGYSSAQIKVETRDALVVTGSGDRLTDAGRCAKRP